jgi:hypothetical protein
MVPLKTVDETTDLSSTQTPTDLMTSTLTSPLHQGVQNGLNSVFASTPSYAETTFQTGELIMPTDEELRQDFEGIWPHLLKHEKFEKHPYLDSNCLDTSGTGHLMDLNNLENDPLIDFSDPQKLKNYLALSQKMKNEICSPNADGKLTTNWTSKAQQNTYSELKNYEVNKEKDKELAYEFFKKRMPQLVKALSIQNPPVKWNNLTPNLKYPLMDILYNPGVETPIYNYKTNKTGWPKLLDAYAKKDYSKAKNELSRKGVSPERTSDLMRFIDDELKRLY